MRFFLACAFAAAAWPESIAVLDEAQIRQLERAVSRNPGDREGQTLLGQNYAFWILGITKLGKYDVLEELDPARTGTEFAQHARDELRHSSLAAVVGEGGYALWKYCTLAEVYKFQKRMANQVPLREERTLAVEAIDRAIAIEPDNGHWRTYRIPILAFRSGNNRTSTLSAADAYDQARKDIATLQGPDRRYMLDTVAKLAIRVAAWDDAQRFAQELLNPDDAHDWYSGNATFFGNMVLGQVALHRGDKAAARAYLLASGRTRGSPQLDSFGPNMALAKELLEAGESDAVLQFFDSCGVFWKLDHGLMQQWKDAVAAGRIPDFGANLRY